MAYYLRQSKKSGRNYLQMYESYWDKEKKQPRSKYIQAFGYVDELVCDEIPNPVSFFKEYVAKENKKVSDLVAQEKRPRAFNAPVEFYLGHFLIKTVLEELNVKPTIELLASHTKFRFNMYDLISQLIFARIIKPCSKSKTVSTIFPYLYEGKMISENQVYDGCEFFGGNYKKYIELFNHQYQKFHKRNFDKAYFDCTNYYFEIDRPCDDKQKGPSKENRHDPIIGQALLLDADLIPVGMEMYPGNESEKPYIRKLIEEMKQRYKVVGKTIQVADKGLNCARNIYAAVKEANDGYIFSKSIHGRNLSGQEKQWILLENESNRYTNYVDKNGKVKFRIKSCVDNFEYSFTEFDDSGKPIKTTFTVTEKRVVSYNPYLADKQKREIKKQVDKVANYCKYKTIAREELGDAVKYLSVEEKDSNGKSIDPTTSLNQAKIDEDLKLAGYNLIVTSEINMEPIDVYKAYHNLWKIEESFRITKSFLDARPVFLQKKESIYGHFLICYLSLFILRVLELKVFKGSVNTYDLVEFIRDFRVAKQDNGRYINLSKNREINEKVTKVTGLNNIDALYLTEKELQNIFNKCALLGE